MKRVYIAGPYSADNIIDCLNNMRTGMQVGAYVLAAGFAPWTPWHDFHHQLMCRDITIDLYYKFSLAWLTVSDAVLVLPGFESSKGTLKEIDYAKKHNIPIIYLDGVDRENVADGLKGL